MKKNNKLIPFLAALAVLLAVPLMLALKDFAREAIVSPLLYAAWLVDFVFKILPQTIFWLLFLSIGILVAVKSLITPHKPESRLPLPEKTYLSRVAVWEKRLQLSKQGDYSRWNLAHHLSDLVVKTMAYTDQLEPESVRQHLRQHLRKQLRLQPSQGSLQAPPEVQAYLREALLNKSPVSPGLLGRLKGFVFRRGFFSKTGQEQIESSALELDPEIIIQYLEQRLEVSHEHRNR